MVSRINNWSGDEGYQKKEAADVSDDVDWPE